MGFLISHNGVGYRIGTNSVHLDHDPEIQAVGLMVTPKGDSVLPDTISVSGVTSYTWNKTTGALVLEGLTKNVTLDIHALAYYDITASLSHVTGAGENASRFLESGSGNLTFSAVEGYELPDTVVVSGAESSWDQATGVLSLTNVQDNISIAIVGGQIFAVTPTLTNLTSAGGNPTTVTELKSAVLTFTANSGYELPDDFTVTGCEYTWVRSNGTLTLSNPTGPVSITGTGLAIYAITPTLTNVTGAAENATTLTETRELDLTFTGAEGYALPLTVGVTGATYTWDPETGVMHLSEVTGAVTITMAGDLIYTITPTLTDVSASVDNPTTIISGREIDLGFTVDADHDLPDTVTVTGVTSSTWDPLTGVLTLTEPTENVTIAITGIRTYTITLTGDHIIPDAVNPIKMRVGTTAEIKFDIEDGYVITAGPTVSGATSECDYVALDESVTVGLSVPTDNITIDLTTAACYLVTYALTNLTEGEAAPTYLLVGGSGNVPLADDTTYGFPESIEVTGADCEWAQATGVAALSNLTGDVVVTAVGVLKYAMTYTLTNVTKQEADIAYIKATDILIFHLEGSEGYALPEDVTVTGASYSWTPETGELIVYGPTSAVTISVTGILFYDISTTLTHVNGVAENPSIILRDHTATLVFIASTGYGLPESVTVTGATGSWTQASGTLELSAPTGDVSVTIAGVEA